MAENRDRPAPNALTARHRGNLTGTAYAQGHVHYPLHLHAPTQRRMGCYKAYANSA